MTIKYSLTKAEIVRAFLAGLGRSKSLAIIPIYVVGLGLLVLAMRGANSRSVTFRDFIVAILWAIGGVLFMHLWLFIRGKTDERTVTVSPEGISTTIGRLSGKVPWKKVKLVTDTSEHAVIEGPMLKGDGWTTTGNAFYIPNRAFPEAGQRAQFISLINQWRNAGPVSD
ncbi:MAG: YcxB family protein [Bryobacteraceae bacterium]